MKSVLCLRHPASQTGRASPTQAREAPLNKGWSEIDEMTSSSAAERTLGAASRSETSVTDVLDKLRNYLSQHADHLN